MSEARFRINSENVVHELVDGEVIAIDLDNGSYYSLSGSGPVIWELLGPGASEAELTRSLGARYDDQSGRIETEVSEFLARLRDNGLVVAAENGDGAAAAADGNGAREPFEPPVFERYTDMKDYFLLDPIHEVSSAGWPKPAP